MCIRFNSDRGRSDSVGPSEVLLDYKLQDYRYSYTRPKFWIEMCGGRHTGIRSTNRRLKSKGTYFYLYNGDQ